MNSQPSGSRCSHDNAPFASRHGGKPIPDETVWCPNCGERVAFSSGEVVTVRETNAKLAFDRETFEEAQRLIRAGDADGLVALAGRYREDRAKAAAAAVRRNPA